MDQPPYSNMDKKASKSRVPVEPDEVHNRSLMLDHAADSKAARLKYDSPPET